MPNKKRCLKFQIWEEGRFLILGPSVCLSPMRRGMGVTLIFSNILRPRLFFGVQKFEFQYFFSSKNWIFWSLKILWICLFFFWGGGGHHKIGLYLDVISMHFCVFSESQGREWRIFFGLLKFQIFIWGAWNSWYFLGVNGRCWARAYIWRKNDSTPPPPPLGIVHQFKPITVKCI